jgi:pimeloyl-ACP methyl ester carboxylesterase
MVIYLHGFASGATSSKATYIGRHLRARGVRFECPDLNLPDFSTLTVTRMLGRVRELLDLANEPVTIIGSSLGGFVAVNAAARWPDLVARVVLLAPAVDFASPAMKHMGEVPVEEWQRTGFLNVFHYGYGRMVPVHYELLEDARRYDALHATVNMPILAFQGRQDDVVDAAVVEAWCRARPNVELRLLDDGHQLTASLPLIADAIGAFVGA